MTTDKHKAKAPKQLCFGIFICSTSRYNKIQSKYPLNDVSGDLIKLLINASGYTIKFSEVIPDDKKIINKCMKQVLNSSDIDIIIFCGGTGITSSDVTIETVLPFIEKVIPGFGELFRHLSYNEIGSAALLSRALAGIVRNKVIFCIPGSPDAVRLCFKNLILPEASHIVKHARE